MKKITSILLSLMIIAAFMPTFAFADEFEADAPDIAVEQIEAESSAAPAEELIEEAGEVIAEDAAEAAPEEAAVEVSEEAAEASPDEAAEAAPEEEFLELTADEAKNAVEVHKDFIYSAIDRTQTIVNGRTDVWTIDMSLKTYNILIENLGTGALTVELINGDGSVADYYSNYYDLCRKTNRMGARVFVSGGNYFGMLTRATGVPKLKITNESGSSGQYRLTFRRINAYDCSFGQLKGDKSGAEIIVASLPSLNEDIVVQVHDNTGYFFYISILDQVADREVKNKNGSYYSEIGYGAIQEIGYAKPGTSRGVLVIERGGEDSTINDDSPEYDVNGKLIHVPEYDKYDYSLAFGVVPANLGKFTSKNITNKTWTGSALKQTAPRLAYGSVFVKNNSYTVSYSGNKAIGTAAIKFTAKAPYIGSKSANFTIMPKGTSISKLSKGKKAFTVKWKKLTTKMPSARISKYQIQYSTNKNFTSVKNKYVSGYKKVSKKVTGLKKKTTYYVRVRTCFKANGKWYYSSWSPVKSVKTK